jgi:oligogalacturonide lyase
MILSGRGCVLLGATFSRYVIMKKLPIVRAAAAISACAFFVSLSSAQVGRQWPSEKKMVIDPVTGTPLTFLTSLSYGDSKIYQTHPDWTSDGQWVIFRSGRVNNQAFAVNEANGHIVQITDKGYMGMLCVSRKTMNLYIMRAMGAPERGARADVEPPAAAPSPDATGPGGPGGPEAKGKRKGGFMRPRGPFVIVEVHLDKIFADSEKGTMGPDETYERVCGTIPTELRAGGNMGLDADEDYVYFSYNGGPAADGVDVNNPIYSQYIEPGTKSAKVFGPRGMGAGPSGLASMNLKTGETKLVTAVPFQIGHVQTNPWVHGEIIFCWETGGKAPQRTWVVNSDGTGLRPLFPEAPFDWVTHEAAITKDEVAIAILAHRHPGLPADTPWGNESSTGVHPSGVGIVNLRTHEMRIVGQVPIGDPGHSIWHVNGSADGRWAAADDFQYRLWVIDRHTGEMILLASMKRNVAGTPADHIHPTFSADGTKLEIQSSMIAVDGRSLNIVVVPMPKSWIARNYGMHAPE